MLLTRGNYSWSSLEEHAEEQSTVFPKVYGYPHANIVCQMHPVNKAAYWSSGVGMCKPTGKRHFSDLQERWASQSAAEQTYFLQTKYSLSVPLTLLCSHQGSFEQSDLCMRYYRSNLPVVESLLYLFFTEQNNYWNDLEVPLLSLKQNEFLGNNGPDSHYH